MTPDDDLPAPTSTNEVKAWLKAWLCPWTGCELDHGEVTGRARIICGECNCPGFTYDSQLRRPCIPGQGVAAS